MLGKDQHSNKQEELPLVLATLGHVASLVNSSSEQALQALEANQTNAKVADHWVASSSSSEEVQVLAAIPVKPDHMVLVMNMSSRPVEEVAEARNMAVQAQLLTGRLLSTHLNRLQRSAAFCLQKLATMVISGRPQLANFCKLANCHSQIQAVKQAMRRPPTASSNTSK